MKNENPVSWQPPRSPLSLREQEIHVWHLDLSDHGGADQEILQAEEVTRYRQFQNRQQGMHYLSSRNQMRRILASYLHVSPEMLKLASGEGGKPRIARPDTTLEFNLSHTGNIALLAVSTDLPVGIDIEKLRPLGQLQQIAHRVFDPAAVRSLQTMSPDGQTERFFNLWTMMEARQKSYGRGIFARKVRAHQVGALQFVPLQGYRATLAWSDPTRRPAVCFFTHDPCR